MLAIEVPVKMEVHVKVVIQIKDMVVFVLMASPHLIVNKVLTILLQLKAFIL